MNQRNLGILPPIILFGFDMFFDDSDELDINNSENDESSKFFVAQIQRMNSMQFKRHFRVDIDTFEDIMEKMYAVYESSRYGRPEISLEESTLVCIWYLANLESLRGLAARFKISKATAWAAVYRICKAFIVINDRYNIIKWPSADRCTTISDSFFRKHEIPGIIGVIDGSHIKINRPKNFPNSYVNRKGYHSLVLQGICDHKKLFIDIYAGEAGSLHDYSVFLKSGVNERPPGDFPNDSHLIGDLAYKLSTKMLVGFKNNGYLTPEQQNFNKKLSKARVIIENSFAHLKGRFRRLKYIETIIPEHICHIIFTSCILHNLCILKGDDADNILNLEEEIRGERFINPQNNLDVDQHLEDNQARLKRNNIINLLI